MAKDAPLSSWLLRLSITMFELARRSQDGELADDMRKIAHDVLERAHKEALLQDERGPGTNDS